MEEGPSSPAVVLITYVCRVNGSPPSFHIGRRREQGLQKRPRTIGTIGTIGVNRGHTAMAKRIKKWIDDRQ